MLSLLLSAADQKSLETRVVVYLRVTDHVTVNERVSVCCQATAVRQEREIGELRSEVSRLDDIRTQQETSIQHLHETVGKTHEESGRRRDQATNTISALTSELRTTKQALEDVTKRERQVPTVMLSKLMCHSIAVIITAHCSH